MPELARFVNLLPRSSTLATLGASREDAMDKSTLADIVGAEGNRGRLVLRAVTLLGLVAFLAAAVFGLFEQPAQATSDDGVVHVDYQGTIRAGRDIDLVVRVQPMDCEQL